MVVTGKVEGTVATTVAQSHTCRALRPYDKFFITVCHFASNPLSARPRRSLISIDGLRRGSPLLPLLGLLGLPLPLLFLLFLLSLPQLFE